jgi:hypothetical protein
MAFRKIKAGLVNSDVEQFIGETGNLFFDIDTGILRLSDGTTPGGNIVSGGSGGSDYTLPTASSTIKGGVKVGSNITITDGVISVAAPFSGSYTDLTNKPTIPSLTGYATETYVTTRGYLTSVGTISYNDLSNKPTLFSGSYTDLTNKPTIPAAQIQSDWNQTTTSALDYIKNKPALFSGSWNDLTDFPTTTGTENLVFSNSPTIDSPTINDGVFQNTFSIGNQIFYEHGYNGFSVNEDFDIVGESNFTGYHYTSGAGRDGVAFTLARTGQFTDGFGITGDAENNQFVIGGEASNTDFLFKTGIGMPFNVSGGTTIFKIGRDGNLTFADETTQTTAWPGTLDQILWINPTPAAGDPFRTAISAASGNASISLTSGLPNLGSTVSWTFDTTKITFPDTTTQTTAWTGSIAYASVTGTPTLATVATSGSYTDLTNKPTLFSGSYTDLTNKPAIPTTVTVNGTSITLGSSGTVTAAAGTLTGTTLNSSVVSSSLTSVGTLTNLSVTNTITGSVSGNAGTATKLATARAINGVDFDGSAAITVTAAAGTLSGNTLASGVLSSSLTSVGTLTGLTTSGAASITYTPGTTVGVALTATGKDTQGGTGYFDFFKATNTTSGVANGSKTFRLSSTGAIEIINSAYSANILSLTDAGTMSTALPYQVAGKQAVNGPAFRAYIDIGQAITSGSQQKVTFGTETFDTNSNFSSSRFTPTVEGYYQLNATVRIAGTATNGEYMLVIWKNGSEYARGHNGSGTEIGASFYSLQVSDIAYANGSSDYFEIYIQQTSGGNRDTTAGAFISYFSGCMIRGA